MNDNENITQLLKNGSGRDLLEFSANADEFDFKAFRDRIAEIGTFDDNFYFVLNNPNMDIMPNKKRMFDLADNDKRLMGVVYTTVEDLRLLKNNEINNKYGDDPALRKYIEFLHNAEDATDALTLIYEQHKVLVANKPADILEFAKTNNDVELSSIQNSLIRGYDIANHKEPVLLNELVGFARVTGVNVNALIDEVAKIPFNNYSVMKYTDLANMPNANSSVLASAMVNNNNVHPHDLVFFAFNVVDLDRSSFDMLYQDVQESKDPMMCYEMDKKKSELDAKYNELNLSDIDLRNNLTSFPEYEEVNDIDEVIPENNGIKEAAELINALEMDKGNAPILDLDSPTLADDVDVVNIQYKEQLFKPENVHVVVSELEIAHNLDLNESHSVSIAHEPQTNDNHVVDLTGVNLSCIFDHAPGESNVVHDPNTLSDELNEAHKRDGISPINDPDPNNGPTGPGM